MPGKACKQRRAERRSHLQWNTADTVQGTEDDMGRTSSRAAASTWDEWDMLEADMTTAGSMCSDVKPRRSVCWSLSTFADGTDTVDSTAWSQSMNRSLSTVTTTTVADAGDLPTPTPKQMPTLRGNAERKARTVRFQTCQVELCGEDSEADEREKVEEEEEPCLVVRNTFLDIMNTRQQAHQRRHSEPSLPARESSAQEEEAHEKSMVRSTTDTESQCSTVESESEQPPNLKGAANSVLPTAAEATTVASGMLDLQGVATAAGRRPSTGAVQALLPTTAPLASVCGQQQQQPPFPDGRDHGEDEDHYLIVRNTFLDICAPKALLWRRRSEPLASLQQGLETPPVRKVGEEASHSSKEPERERFGRRVIVHRASASA